MEKDTGVPVHFLCLHCFAGYAAQMVTEDNPDWRVIWKLEIGSREAIREAVELASEALLRHTDEFLLEPASS